MNKQVALEMKQVSKYFGSLAANKNVDLTVYRGEILAILGACFSVAFMILQLIPIPGLEGVHFGWQSYVMLGIWVLLGVLFYFTRAKDLQAAAKLE